MKELLLWGFHPKHQPTPIKLSVYSKMEQRFRERLGWTTAVYAAGDEPTGLLLIATQTSPNFKQAPHLFDEMVSVLNTEAWNKFKGGTRK